jgi:hypothetical protein
VSYATWPYDRSIVDPISTLSGRLGRAIEDESSAPQPAPAPLARSGDDRSEHRVTMSSLVRAARGMA